MLQAIHMYTSTRARLADAGRSTLHELLDVKCFDSMAHTQQFELLDLILYRLDLAQMQVP